MTLFDEIKTLDAGLVDSRDYQAIADAINATRPPVLSLYTIGERGIIAALGTIEGEACLQAFEAFSATPLSSGHPLEAHYPGIKRLLGWLKSAEGVDIGNAQAATLLGAMAQVGILQKAWVDGLLSLATKSAEQITAARVASIMTGGA